MRPIVTAPAILRGEPCFEGTRISIRHVLAALANGSPLAELTEDYGVTADELKAAVDYLAANQPPPSPRKRGEQMRQHFVDALRNTYTQSGLDHLTEEEQLKVRRMEAARHP